LRGACYNAFPALFHLAAALQLHGRPFAVLFRSFRAEFSAIQEEWNAFCELRHPVFSRLIKHIGAMDGTDPKVPDRRIHSVHTLYHDISGPALMLDTLTRGPATATWDDWAKARPRPKVDTRRGRDYASKVLKATMVDGFDDVQEWMDGHLWKQATAIIKDDWAWWHHNGERSAEGKLLTLLDGLKPTRQVFFDDEIALNDAKIVDCRDPDGSLVPAARSLSSICVKVNPVEAVLDHEYFMNRLLAVEACNQYDQNVSNQLGQLFCCAITPRRGHVDGRRPQSPTLGPRPVGPLSL